MRQIIILTIALAALGCGPGDYEVAPEASASESCAAFCEVRSTCDPTAASPAAAECFEACMGLSSITDESTCGAAQREVYSCIGDLACEGYDATMTPDPASDPCADSKLRFAELTCGAEVSP